MSDRGQATGTEPPVVPFADLAPDRAVTAVGPDGGARLIAARCTSCGAVWFPLRPVCPTCGAGGPEQYLVGPGATLYSYSTVHVSSARETPYSLGYLDLDEGIRVLATVEPADRLQLDSRYHLQVDGGRWWFVPEEHV